MELEYEILMALQKLHTPFLDKLVVGITSLGNGGIIWILLGVVLLCREKSRPMGILVLLALVLDYLSCNVILKNLIARDRPCWVYTDVKLLITSPGDFSFPSGHTASSFAAAAAVFIKNRKLGIWVLILAALIGFTRLYLFVHWPTDVLGGLLLGIGCAFAARFFLDVWNRRQKPCK
ncbi:MAG: phosphatase PAP2 family protein [Lachnospiraceae bacterium]|jgi:undecaprenyl-diphosphatase